MWCINWQLEKQTFLFRKILFTDWIFRGLCSQMIRFLKAFLQNNTPTHNPDSSKFVGCRPNGNTGRPHDLSLFNCCQTMTGMLQPLYWRYSQCLTCCGHREGSVSTGTTMMSWHASHTSFNSSSHWLASQCVDSLDHVRWPVPRPTHLPLSLVVLYVFIGSKKSLECHRNANIIITHCGNDSVARLYRSTSIFQGAISLK